LQLQGQDDDLEVLKAEYQLDTGECTQAQTDGNAAILDFQVRTYRSFLRLIQLEGHLSKFMGADSKELHLFPLQAFDSDAHWNVERKENRHLDLPRSRK